jgi:hypothetical protein
MAVQPRESKLTRLAAGVARGLSLRRAALLADLPAMVDDIRRSLINQTVGRLVRSAGKAAVKLEKHLNSKDENISLRAARGILSDLITIQSHAELADRLTALEAHVKASQKDDNR